MSPLSIPSTLNPQNRVHVYTLSSSDFNDALKWYPGEKIDIQKVAIDRMDMLLAEMKRKTQGGRTSLTTEVISDLQKYRNMLQVHPRISFLSYIFCT